MPDPTKPTKADQVASLEAEVDDAIASCEGDARATVRSLLLALNLYEAELSALQEELGRLSAAVSPGYVRERARRGPGKQSG